MVTLPFQTQVSWHGDHRVKYEEIILERDGLNTKEKRLFHYGKRSIEFFHSLPFNSPIRRSFLRFLTQNVSSEGILKDFEISRRTLFRAVSSDGDFFLDLKYCPGVKRNRTTDGQLQIALNSL